MAVPSPQPRATPAGGLPQFRRDAGDGAGSRSGGRGGVHPWIGFWLRDGRALALLGAAVLCLLFVLAYAADPALPGSRADQPAGWWGWFDQAQTLRSTAALASGDLRPSEHHYFLGYSLLGVPFWLLGASDPFAAVNLLSLLAAFGGFVALARRLGLPVALSVPLFLFAAATDATLFRQWVVPWNTTPIGGAMWLLLALGAAWLDGVRRPVVVGLLTAGILACRPGEAVLLLPILLTIAWTELRARRWRSFPWLALGGLIVALPVGVLYLLIYGPQPSNYMRISAGIGFSLHDLGWKAFVVLLDPYSWFADGEGLVQRSPWMALALPGALVALLRGPRDRMLAATLAVHAVFYVSYVDLLPTGLWRFLNVHYWVWAIPGYALLAALLGRDLLRGPNRLRLAVAGALVVSAAVLCLRFEPKAAGVEQPAKAVDFAGPLPPFLGTYFGVLALRDRWGTLYNNGDVRALVYPGGVRVVALRRPLVGPLEWLPDQAPPGFDPAAPQTRWVASLRWGWPRWIERAKPPRVPIPVQ
ncbi:hypothetical protein [Roseomonas sp. BN140053]|uniref:hypothetical protein n=1 Tax=Roseomonas sp. BN140053 TaxID=3391898 RepID=UPI0039EB9E9B